jgi:hypothetical protein
MNPTDSLGVTDVRTICKQEAEFTPEMPGLKNALKPQARVKN